MNERLSPEDARALKLRLAMVRALSAINRITEPTSPARQARRQLVEALDRDVAEYPEQNDGARKPGSGVYAQRTFLP